MIGQSTSPAGSEAPPLLLLTANSAWNILNFRIDLVRAFQAAGYRIAVAAPPDGAEASLEAADVRFLPLPMRADGTSPVQDALLLHRYYRLIDRLRPAAMLAFTAKPNIYGSIAAHSLKVPVINTITGLGTSFIHGSRLESIVSALYRVALRRSAAVFFHNDDDRALFVDRGLVRADQAQVVAGSGIDLDRFAAQPLPPAGGGPTFLFVGRMLWEKGVGELAEAAAAVRQSCPEARIRLVGGLAEGNRGVPADQLVRWQSSGLLEYAGPSEDIRPHIAAADCLVLPSYREGLPRVLLEGAAMARPAIATDVPGCRQAIRDGVTGFLCAPRSGPALADAMLRFIDLSQSRRQEMGRQARQLAEEQFGARRVSDAYLSVLDGLRAAVPCRDTPPEGGNGSNSMRGSDGSNGHG